MFLLPRESLPLCEVYLLLHPYLLYFCHDNSRLNAPELIHKKGRLWGIQNTWYQIQKTINKAPTGSQVIWHQTLFFLSLSCFLFPVTLCCFHRLTQYELWACNFGNYGQNMSPKVFLLFPFYSIPQSSFKECLCFCEKFYKILSFSYKLKIALECSLITFHHFI